MDDQWGRSEPAQSDRKDRRCMLRCNTQPAFTVCWRNGKIVNSWTFVDKKMEATKHRTEWFAAASKYRCMKCGRSSNKMQRPGTFDGPRRLGKDSSHKLEL